MFYHIKYRKKGGSKTKCYRRNGKILVFNNHNNALNFIKSLEGEGLVCGLIKSEYNPKSRKSPLWKRNFELIG